MQDSFLFNLDLIDENDQTKDDLVEMRDSMKIKMEFDSMHLATFWCAQLEMCSQLAKVLLVPFATIYLCQTGFPTVVSIKTKPRNRLKPGDDMRVAVIKKEPHFTLIIKRMQQQKGISDKYFNV